MNKVQAKRLLNVAKSLRDAHASKKNSKFAMDTFVVGQEDYLSTDANGKVCNTEAEFCGTPACALGHYASRTDLQRLLKIAIKKTEEGVPFAELQFFGTSSYAMDITLPEILEHFGITEEESNMLFNWDGCDRAKTPLQAAKFIERFVQEKLYPGRNPNRQTLLQKYNENYY